MIPLVDLKVLHSSISDELAQAIDRVTATQSFISGTETAAFEKAFSSVHQTKHAIGCSNGTSALTVVLESLGVGQGDEVITTPHTFIASAASISLVGAKPVFVDIDPKTYNIDTTRIEEKINKRTKAILPVHIYGNPCNLKKIFELATRYQLFVIEDCAQAHLASIDDQMVGSQSNAATFSFYPGKNLGAWGDAGAILTNDDVLSNKMRATINHGRSSTSGKYLHQFIGSNFRIDELQSAILRTKLSHLKSWTERRRAIAATYDKSFNSNGFKTIEQLPKHKCCYHQYTLEVSQRDTFQEKMKANGVATGIHYPIPLHLQPAFSFLEHRKGDFPVAERVADSIVSIPMCPTLTDQQVQSIILATMKYAAPPT